MTGELTLTVLVLPVGGIKEKVLAAHRNGIRHIILPADNQADLSRLPATVRNDLEFTLAETLRDVLAVTLPHLDAMSDEIAVIGSEEEVQERIRTDAHTGVHTQIIAPMSATTQDTLRTLNAFTAANFSF